MKYTEGAFRNWGYELAESEFAEQVYTWSQWERTRYDAGEESANAEQDAAVKAGKLIIKDVIADIVFQQTITRARDFDVLATMNLNGDYLSDALAAQVGGIGIAPAGISITPAGTPSSKPPMAPLPSMPIKTWSTRVR